MESREENCKVILPITLRLVFAKKRSKRKATKKEKSHPMESDILQEKQLYNIECSKIEVQLK